MNDSVDPRVQKIMKISELQPPQRHPDWLRKRYNFLTASQLASTVRLIQHEIDLRDQGIIELELKKKVGQVVPAYDSYNALMLKKAAPYTEVRDPPSDAMMWGVAYEEIITRCHEFFIGCAVYDFNLIPHPTIDFLGASPDGISADGRMLEIKCPMMRIPSGLPKIQYWMQMQLQMECCDLDVCDFLDVMVREYGNRESYVNDSFVDDEETIYSRNKAGLPKGFIIEESRLDLVSGETKSKFYYPPVLRFTCEEEENEWLREWAAAQQQCLSELEPQEMLDHLVGVTYHIRYWYIAQWEQVQIKRDKEWFATRLPDFQNFWNLVLGYRASGELPAKRPESSQSVLKLVENAKSEPVFEMSRAPTRSESRAAKLDKTNSVCMFMEDDSD